MIVSLRDGISGSVPPAPLSPAKGACQCYQHLSEWFIFAKHINYFVLWSFKGIQWACAVFTVTLTESTSWLQAGRYPGEVFNVTLCTRILSQGINEEPNYPPTYVLKIHLQSSKTHCPYYSNVFTTETALVLASFFGETQHILLWWSWCLANPLYLNVKCCNFYHSLDYAKSTVITLLAYWFLLPVITLFRLPNNALYSIISNTEQFVILHISLQIMISKPRSVWFSLLFDKSRTLSLL